MDQATTADRDPQQVNAVVTPAFVTPVGTQTVMTNKKMRVKKVTHSCYMHMRVHSHTHGQVTGVLWKQSRTSTRLASLQASKESRLSLWSPCRRAGMTDAESYMLAFIRVWET